MPARDPTSSRRPLHVGSGGNSPVQQMSPTVPWTSFRSRMASSPTSASFIEPSSHVLIPESHNRNIPRHPLQDFHGSYARSASLNLSRSHQGHPVSFSDTADNIRDFTVQLASLLPASPKFAVLDGAAADYFSAPLHDIPEAPESSSTAQAKNQQIRETSLSPTRTNKGSGPSSLTIQLRRHSNPPSTLPSREVSPMRPRESNPTIPEMLFTTPTDSDDSETPRARHDDVEHRKISQHLGRLPIPDILPTDITPLLSNVSLPSYMISGRNSSDNSLEVARLEPRRSKSLSRRFRLAMHSSIDTAKTAAKPGFWQDLFTRTVASIPAVFLGLLLNILDGVSYGMIMFPAGKIFEGFGPMGVSLFFVTTIIAQLVFTFGGSAFPGGNGSMMIEVVPFFNIMANQIIQIVGEDNPQSVIATTLAAFSFSAILTGITFFIMGKFQMGALIGFFPRHILVGCIGGVGWFLIETGFEVAAGMNEESGFEYNMKTLNFLFSDQRIMGLWMSALALAVILRIITEKYQHQLIFPIYFLCIPAIFYIVIAAGHFDLQHLREMGWLFDVGTAHEPWWKIYTYWDLRKVNYLALLKIMPTQLALLFFNILHPPLNVPALSVSLDQEIDLNKELVAHGYSNVLAGLFGTSPNYLVYVNTVLFYRVGGTTRLAGFLLACATAGIMLAGTTPIGYLPVMVVGALIFVLGIDLVREALWDTRHRVSKTEYVTILSIIICMTVFDFVIGVLFGLVLACFFFVVQNSQNRSIRALYTGDSAMSTVRRPSAHRKYLQEVGRQTAIMKLQSYLFFGTITYVEEAAKEFLDAARWTHNPIRFLVVDFSLVLGVDLSASEAFVRLQRVLESKSVTLVICGFRMDSPIGRALKSVDLFDGPNVEVFSDINDAMEWTENVYLKAWFDSIREEHKVPEAKPISLPGRAKLAFTMGESWQQSPRRSHIHSVAGRVLRPFLQESEDGELASPTDLPEPATTLMKTFSGYDSDLTPTFFLPILRYFTRVQVREGIELWRRGDKSDGLYVVESGVLRAIYDWDHADIVTESMVPGTLAGELSSLANMPRNATVVVEKASVLWKLTRASWAQFKEEQPGLAHHFVELVLKVAKNDYDVLISACSRR
ncbi:hypothetical protein FRC16_006812 [Serendipita sp. 398]|nr:hypothetical protein FRC16_006812 [Serendipita sp. 398]